MPSIFEVNVELVSNYRERLGNPDFWAEPLNALSNASFVVAAFFAWDLANGRRANCRVTVALVSLVGVIGFGSFFFHTVPNRITMAFDILPIVLFQIVYLWLSTNRMLSLSRLASLAIVVSVTGLSLALLSLQKPLNGSLFYLPSLLAMFAIGSLWSRKTSAEPYLLIGAAVCFCVAIMARTVDKTVPWHFGTHFVWHLLNGLVVYLALRAWVISSQTHSENRS